MYSGHQACASGEWILKKTVIPSGPLLQCNQFWCSHTSIFCLDPGVPLPLCSGSAPFLEESVQMWLELWFVSIQRVTGWKVPILPQQWGVPFQNWKTFYIPPIKFSIIHIQNTKTCSLLALWPNLKKKKTQNKAEQIFQIIIIIHGTCVM